MRYAFLALLVLACSRGAPSDDSTVATVSRRGVPTTAAKSSEAPLTCGVGTETRVTGAGVGELQIGRSTEDVRRLCNVTRDTTMLGAEALPERVLRVATVRDTLDVTIDNDRLWRISVDRPVLRTVDSLGVGTTLADLLRSPGATGAEGEGVLYVIVSAHCGMSFRLSKELSASQHRDHWSENDLRKLPSTATVDQVLITGCQKEKTSK